MVENWPLANGLLDLWKSGDMDEVWAEEGLGGAENADSSSLRAVSCELVPTLGVSCTISLEAWRCI